MADELKQYFSCISNSSSTRGASYNWLAGTVTETMTCPRHAARLPVTIDRIIDTPAHEKIDVL